LLLALCWAGDRAEKKNERSRDHCQALSAARYQRCADSLIFASLSRHVPLKDPRTGSFLLGVLKAKVHPASVDFHDASDATES